MTALTLELALALLILVVFLVGLFSRADDKRSVGLVAIVGMAGLFALSFLVTPGESFMGGSFVLDGLAIFAKQLFILATLIGLLGSHAMQTTTFKRRASEYYLLILTSLLGMMVLASARELILLFVAFELMSIPLYVLAGFTKREGESVEASLKFFLVGSVSSAIMAYGLSFLYGLAGSTYLTDISKLLNEPSPLFIFGMLAVFAGFGFKIAAFPFHMWVPDTYEAAPTPFVAWLSVAPKAAGFVALFRVYLEGVGEGAEFWVPVAAGLAAITIVAGNLMALPQTNVKRLLAYSGIAHIGYMLVGFAAVSTYGMAWVLFYLVAYVFANMGAFLVVEAVAQHEGSVSLSAFRGLAQRSPLLALAMLLFLLSLGGIPFMIGFWAKLYVFWAAAQVGLYWLVLIGAVLTVVALFYYLAVAKQMYISQPEHVTKIELPLSLGLAIMISAVAVVALGVWPRPLVEATLRVAATFF